MTTVQDDITEAQQEAERLTSLLKLFPDLTQETSRWRRVFQCSKSITENSSATGYEIAYSCGCCPDPAMYVRLYVETPHGKVYGVPHQVCIGERSWDYIDCPERDWEDVLKRCGAPEPLLERLRVHFAAEDRRKLDREYDDR